MSLLDSNLPKLDDLPNLDDLLNLKPNLDGLEIEILAKDDAEYVNIKKVDDVATG